MTRVAVILGLIAAAMPGATAPARDGPGFVIMPSSAIKPMLDQCSRATPKPGRGHWIAAAADIARMEKAVAAAIAGTAKANRGELDGFPGAFGRQYVGYVRGGRFYIYGNFAPASIAKEYGRSWRTTPFAVCDGGVGLFGAEFDVKAGKITHLAFNGYV